ncbi:hypothetical protein BDV96DRAFT_666867 [Lophiotrema nucula]|uniref:RING-type domain-containing protein n=1 Tax=Lophiotrema nucula TaxID=690887 RepID=A0A6A5YTN0_9PLEO|nr:hypothetical protein BDV96DRAFT_666867 [Lophiotrema nucula]
MPQKPPPPDRSDYWIKAHQICWTFMLVDWLHPLRDVQDPLYNTRVKLSWNLQNLLRKGYLWWADRSLRTDAGEKFTKFHTLGFLFQQLRDFLDDHQWFRAISNTQMMVQFFYWHHMDAMKCSCSCKGCVQAVKVWDKRTWGFDDPRYLVNTSLEIHEKSIEGKLSAMMSWKAENPLLRHTEEYLRQRESFKLTPALFGALGAEFRAFHGIAHTTLASISRTIVQAKLVPVRRPDTRDVVHVTNVEELDESDCVICCSAFDTKGSADGLPSSSLQQQPARARCGHLLCFECYQTIIKEDSLCGRRCPFCREPFVPPPQWYTKSKGLVDALHDRKSSGEVIVDRTLKSLDAVIASSPAPFKTHAKFSMIEGCIGFQPNPFMLDGRVHILLHNLLGPTDKVIPWVKSIRSSVVNEGRWAYQFLRLNGERLEAFRDGDTARYRQVLKLLWPAFVRYNVLRFITQVKIWAREMEIQGRIFRNVGEPNV